MPHKTRRFASQYCPLDLLIGVSLIGLTHRLCEYHYMFSNFNIGKPLFVLLELYSDIFLGDTPLITVAVVGDTETQLIEDRDPKDVRNSLFFQPSVDGAVLPSQVCKCCTCITVDVQESL